MTLCFWLFAVAGNVRAESYFCRGLKDLQIHSGIHHVFEPEDFLLNSNRKEVKWGREEGKTRTLPITHESNLHLFAKKETIRVMPLIETIHFTKDTGFFMHVYSTAALTTVTNAQCKKF